MENIFYWVKDDVSICSRYSYVEHIDDHTITLKNIEDGTIVNKHKKDVLLGSGEYCENLMNLTYLNEAEILNTIHIGYTQDFIYTLNDSILIATNPYKKIDIYGDNVIHQYYKKETTKPHPYLIANNAFTHLQHFKRNQTILVSGESGAGKTQTTNYLMKYISRVSNYTTKNNIEKQLMAPNTILEAFGNAKTIRNDNSSRFGKFIKLLFNERIELVGANIHTYLLEKVRVTNTNKHEQNFHIFYILLNGLSVEDRRTYTLEDASTYRYLHFENASTSDFTRHYNELMNAFSLLDFTDEDMDHIIKTISFILHLGNIQSLDNRDDIDICVELFGLNVDMFMDLFEYRYLSVGFEKIQIKNTEVEFAIIRDTFAQILYQSLFDYIVHKINRYMDTTYTYFIGIVDIFGFEVFLENGFEQVCINYTNEKLQNIFNKYIFEQQQKEYIKEEIVWTHIEYPDNKPIVDLFERKGGFFSLIEEQCILKSGKDSQLYDKLVTLMTTTVLLNIEKRDKMDKKISIRHYAGDVLYTIVDFIHKNKNNADDRIFTLLDTAVLEIPFTKPTSNQSILKQFKTQLNQLLNVLENTDQHYIRCIKPNDQNKSNTFNRKRVYEQLTYCGVLEAVKIARLGYSIQIDKFSFINEFYPLIIKQRVEAKVENISIFLGDYIGGMGLHSSSISLYQIGVSKIFLKRHVYEKLIYEKKAVLRTNADYIQTYVRGWIYHRQYKRLRKSVVCLQTIWRCFQVRKKRALDILTAILNTYICRKRYLNVRECSCIIQRFIRRCAMKKLYNVITIQSYWRMIIQKRTYRKLIHYILKIQRRFRVYKKRTNTIKIEIENIQIDDLQKELVNKNNYIEILLLENKHLKEALKGIYTTDTHMDFSNEIASKMEHLYLKLSIAEAELLKIKREHDVYTRQQQPGILRSIKSILFD